MSDAGIPSVPLPTTLSERFHSLISFDCIRVSRILETAQYAILFGILALIVGFLIDWFFRPLYPVPKKSQKCSEPIFSGGQILQAIVILLLQVMISAVLVIYIRKIGELVPFLTQMCPDRYVPHWKVKELEGELAIALVYVGVQTSLIDTLAALRRSFAYVRCQGTEEER